MLGALLWAWLPAHSCCPSTQNLRLGVRVGPGAEDATSTPSGQPLTPGSWLVPGLTLGQLS